MTVATKEELPLRQRVEVVIRKGDEFLLIKSPLGSPDWRSFPGGGVDDHTEEEACIMECLEEVGIRPKNLQKLCVAMTENYISGKGDRQKKFRGSHTIWYRAEFDRYDNCVLGADGDAKPYEWHDYKTAVGMLKRSNGPRVQHQLAALWYANTNL